MKKFFIFSLLLLSTQIAHAQEEAGVEVSSFWQDKTFLMLAGGAILLIILLIIKKVMSKKSSEENQEEISDTTEKYESN